MAGTFAEMARSIIRSSIVSAIYIDDDIIEPYSGQTEADKHQFALCQKMYESFRREGKSINFYKFQKDRDWRLDGEYLFRNRDLLILDWTLEPAKGFSQPRALEILHAAVKMDSLHFVSIYTSEDDIQSIFYFIKSYFCSFYSKEFVDNYGKLIENIDSKGINTNFLDSLKGDFQKMTMVGPSAKKEELGKLKEKIRGHLKDEYKMFAQFVETASTYTSIVWEMIGYHLNKHSFGPAGPTYWDVHTAHIAERFVVINNTIIQIANKKDPGPEELFLNFTAAVQKAAANILTLVALEIRTLLRESSGFVGNNVGVIGDPILLFQKGKKEDFVDFLVSIVRNQQFSYFDYKYEKLTSTKESFWQSYAAEKNIAASVAELDKKDDKLYEALFRLNVFYNELPVKKRHTDLVKFGDLFYFESNGTREQESGYFLCITAHCDCLRPQNKLRNNFYFIGGVKRRSIREALEQGDTGMLSYVYHGENAIAIGWEPNPIVLNIPDNKMNESLSLLVTDGLGEKYILTYISTLKESYAQRMANNSFGFAMRVGVDFSSL